MAAFYKYSCSDCSFNIETSGLHEFKFKNDLLETLPHPVRNEPCDGIYLNLFCLKCIQNAKLIIVKFKRSVNNPWNANKDDIDEQYLSNYSGYINHNPNKQNILTECYNFNIIICPICKIGEVITDENDVNRGYVLFKSYSDVKYSCPSCQEGILKLINLFIT